MKDLFGQAMLDYQTQNNSENIFTSTNISDTDQMETAYLFRTFDAMPKLERHALEFARGKTLDVGCGAGSHALHLQDQKNLQTFAIDTSALAIQTCVLRDVQHAFVKNIFDLVPNDFGLFDTILLLMNGTGICGKLSNIDHFLQKLTSLLVPDGQILIDSSDIAYMYDKDKRGAPIVDDNSKYYGELEFTVTYKKQTSKPFDWLFLDFKKLDETCKKNKLSCELLLKGEHYDYLAKITRQE